MLTQTHQTNIHMLTRTNTHKHKLPPVKHKELAKVPANCAAKVRQEGGKKSVPENHATFPNVDTRKFTQPLPN